MGLFDDYGIDPDSIKESSFDIDDGTYYFEIGEAERQDGTTNNPENTVMYIEYNLFNEDDEAVGNKRAYYTLAEDGDSETKRVQQSMSFLKADLKRLGFTDLSNFDEADLVGLKGVLQLKSTPGKGANKGKMFQNIRNIRVNEEEAPAPAPKKAPAKKPAAKPAARDTAKEDAAAKARVAAKRAAREEEPESEDDEDENPFGG